MKRFLLTALAFAFASSAWAQTTPANSRWYSAGFGAGAVGRPCSECQHGGLLLVFATGHSPGVRPRMGGEISAFIVSERSRAIIEDLSGYDGSSREVHVLLTGMFTTRWYTSAEESLHFRGGIGGMFFRPGGEYDDVELGPALEVGLGTDFPIGGTRLLSPYVNLIQAFGIGGSPHTVIQGGVSFLFR